MGGKNSKERAKEFNDDYEELQTEYSHHFGELVIYRKRNNQNIAVMAKEVIFQDSELYGQFQNKLNSRKGIRSDKVSSLLKVIGKP